ncbi:MBL fold metallo-hydrolase [Lysobacter korlensis]|uniref:MBL fold metallo-hydrolase n=1 Tax=Lysobacter korlensis TaxID=553636 RepID=A0ABV6RKA2_9GAMM
MTVRVHHLNCGTMCPLGGRLVDDRTRGFGSATTVCHCLLIETDAGLVLVDTGLGRKDVDQARERLGRPMRALLRPRLEMAETADEQIRRLGYATRDVRHIVLTHLDFDHAGGIEDFPYAHVHVYAEELNAATHRRGFIARQRYRPRQWDQTIQWKTYVAHGEPWFGFRCVREIEGLPPEILMVPLVGHTYGHCGVAVHDGAQWLLHAGDAYFFRDEIPQRSVPGPALPRCTPGLALLQRVMQVDRTARLLNQQRLRELAVQHGDQVRIFSAHDAVEFERLTAARVGGPGSR